MIDFPAPPWTPSEDEIVSTDRSAFATCDQMVDRLALDTEREVVDRSYTNSNEWGAVLRAKAVSRRDPRIAPALITCWSLPGDAAAIIVDMGPTPRD